MSKTKLGAAVVTVEFHTTMDRAWFRSRMYLAAVIAEVHGDTELARTLYAIRERAQGEETWSAPLTRNECATALATLKRGLATEDPQEYTYERRRAIVEVVKAGAKEAV